MERAVCRAVLLLTFFHDVDSLTVTRSLGFAESPPAACAAGVLFIEAVVRTQGRGDLEPYTEIVTGVSLASLRLLRENDSPSAFAASAVDLYSLKGVGEEVAVATDFDDTCVSSGGWRIKGTGTYLGGVDPAFPRGPAYPGFGALLYLLSQGTRRWIGSQRRQVHVQQVLLHQQQQKQLQLVLPVVLASARPSIRIGFRPKSLYRHIAAIYLREAELLGVKRPPSTPIVTYENRVNLIKAAFTGQPTSSAIPLGGMSPFCPR